MTPIRKAELAVRDRLLSELCEVISSNGFPARLEGPDRTVSAANTLEDAGPNEITFFSNPKYEKNVASTKAAAIVLKDGTCVPENVSAIRCEDPYAAITVAIIALHGYRKAPPWGLSNAAFIHSSAQLGDNANVAAGATIGAETKIGDNCTLYPGCYVGDGVTIGNDCTLYPNVVIYEQCVLGDRVTIHAGSVIGEDGLGYAPMGKSWVKIPQIGRTILGDDVEIGANCTIDRATLGQTTIGEGTKFGNVVVIGHGTKVGPNCMFVGLVGVAGSVNVGAHVTLAGQVGVKGHVSIGDDSQVAGQGGVFSNLEPNSRVLGTPAIPLNKAKRSMVMFERLPDLAARIKELEEQLEQVKSQINGKP